ncbi:hypothetical protein [Streptomyces sp. NPDC097619]|uniref:hypothetical protein n=1 Tax=Streptomyces sp. NPDC097619 TaxID=3157228 RepID=UPI00332B9EF3
MPEQVVWTNGDPTALPGRTRAKASDGAAVDRNEPEAGALPVLAGHQQAPGGTGLHPEEP